MDSRPTREPVIVPQPDGMPTLPRPTRAARVRMRLKGHADGPVYQGQALVRPCPGCGGRLTAPPGA